MAKTRLLARHREILKNFAKSVVATPEADEAVSAALTALNAEIVPLLDRAFPLSDMAVLYRYRLASEHSHVYVRWDDSKYNAYKRANLVVPRLLPVDHNHTHTDHLTLPEGHPVYALIDVWAKLVDRRKSAQDYKREMYNDLIDASRSFEELLETWPEAELARPLLHLPAPNPVAKISSDTLAFIRADCATRFPPKTTP